jgi:hypothetical protein
MKNRSDPTKWRPELSFRQIDREETIVQDSLTEVSPAVSAFGKVSSPKATLHV